MLKFQLNPFKKPKDFMQSFPDFKNRHKFYCS